MEISERVYDLLVDTEIVVDVMLGSTSISVGEFLKLTEGDIISLHKPAGSGGEIYVNSRIIGKLEFKMLWIQIMLFNISLKNI